MDTVQEDYSIHVRTPNDDIYNKVVEALRPLGVEIVAGETEPLVMALFYLSRMNTKLDNLGQLRHLYDLVKLAPSIKKALELTTRLNNDIMNERTTRQWAALRHYEGLKELYGVDPEIDPTLIKYLSFEEIRGFFS